MKFYTCKICKNIIDEDDCHKCFCCNKVVCENCKEKNEICTNCLYDF